MSKQKTKNVPQKNVLQKGLETFKKWQKWLRRGLNPQLSWLITVCLRGFDRNAPQKMTGVPCLPSTSVLNENQSSYQLAISTFKFPDMCIQFCFDVCLECEITVLSKLNSKKRVWKSIDIQKKKICSPTGFKPTTS